MGQVFQCVVVQGVVIGWGSPRGIHQTAKRSAEFPKCQEISCRLHCWLERKCQEISCRLHCWLGNPPVWAVGAKHLPKPTSVLHTSVMTVSSVRNSRERAFSKFGGDSIHVVIRHLTTYYLTEHSKIPVTTEKSNAPLQTWNVMLKYQRKERREGKSEPWPQMRKKPGTQHKQLILFCVSNQPRNGRQQTICFFMNMKGWKWSCLLTMGACGH